MVEDLGPSRHAATESFEGSNKIVRNCVQHSTRLNPSKDVALQFANNICVRHVGDGGSFKLNGEFVFNDALKICSPTSNQKEQITVGSFIQLQGHSILFMKVTEIGKVELKGQEFLLEQGKYYLKCPVLKPSNHTVQCSSLNAVPINVQHCCNHQCKIISRQPKQRSEISRHNSVQSHVGVSVCINVFSFQTRKLVSDLLLPSTPVDPIVMEQSLNQGWELMAEAKLKSKSKKKRQVKNKQVKRTRVNEDDDDERDSEMDYEGVD
ncbi:hypothetical protein HDU79_000863 [Rhizoclosmatium sp. JEL0117]|nr:hypothetical protein HDU79_000863 [Rhizoclosmatium sp. JEL0117]